MKWKGSSKLEWGLEVSEDGYRQAQSWDINRFAVCFSRNAREGAAILSLPANSRASAKMATFLCGTPRSNIAQIKQNSRFPGWNTNVRSWGPCEHTKAASSAFWDASPASQGILAPSEKLGFSLSHSSPSPRQLCPRKLWRALAGDEPFQLIPAWGICPKGNPEFTCAAEIAVPKLLQLDLKPFWPQAPCSWHSAAVTVQSQTGPRSILASPSRIGESI